MRGRQPAVCHLRDMASGFGFSSGGGTVCCGPLKKLACSNRNGVRTAAPRLRCAYIKLVLLAAVAGCGDPRTARERAQSPPEPTRTLTPVNPEHAGSFSGTIRFASAMTIDAIRVASPTPLQPGQVVAVSLSTTGDTGHCQLGLRPPRTSARQIVPRGDEAPPPEDPRARWVSLADSVEVELPAPWHPPLAVIEVRCDNDPALAGPRTDDGRALLAQVPVAAVPTHLAVKKLAQSPNIDGVLDESAWQVPGHQLVTSLDGEPDPDTPTRVWTAWDDQHLYFAGDIPDIDIFSEYRQHDDPLYKQDVFEVFIAGDNSGNNYLEYQISARGVTFDAAFPRYRKGDEAWDSSWQTAVQVDGTLDGPVDRDRGWSAEVAIAWSEICEHTTITCPPQAGTTLRANIFRLDRPGRRGTKGLALTPTRKPDFHAWEHAATLELMP